LGIKGDNPIAEKSYAFALRIVRFYRHHVEIHKEYVLSKQLLRCGTSIGANVQEGIGAQSRPDFISKMSIAYKEARETSYWLNLLKDSGYLEKRQAESLLEDSEELCRILAAILLSTKNSRSAEQSVRNSESA
jgi:four helix bundle protein